MFDSPKIVMGDGLPSEDRLFISDDEWAFSCTSNEDEASSTWAERLEDDKMFLMQDDNYLLASSNMMELMEMAQVEEVTPEEADFSSQTFFMQEIERFLLNQDTHKAKINQALEDSGEHCCPVTLTEFSKDDLAQSEDLIDALYKEIVGADDGDEELPAGMQQLFKGNVILVVNPTDSVTDDDQEPVAFRADSVSTAQTSQVSKRAICRRSKLYQTDRRQRKKLQNVAAARRYRDKKKTEQQLMEEEIEGLVAMNQSLKAQVADRESEVKTMRKLLKEIGLL